MINVIKDNVSPLIKDNKIFLPPNFKHFKIDVGLSHNAPNSSLWLDSQDDVIVIGIEPNPLAIQMIKGEVPPPYPTQYKLNKNYINSRFFLIPAALSNYNGKATFYAVKNNVDENMNGYDLGSSSLNKPTYFEYNEITVEVIRLEELFKIFDWNSIPFISQLKIDAQGEDFKIVEGIGPYLDKIVNLSIETYVGDQYVNLTNDLNNIEKLLFDNGFVVTNKSTTDAHYFNTKYANLVLNFNPIFI